MRFTVPILKSFIASLDAIRHFVPAKSAMPVFTHFLFECKDFSDLLTVSAFGGLNFAQMQIPVIEPMAGSIAVPALKLIEVLKSFDDMKIVIESSIEKKKSPIETTEVDPITNLQKKGERIIEHEDYVLTLKEKGHKSVIKAMAPDEFPRAPWLSEPTPIASLVVDGTALRSMLYMALGTVLKLRSGEQMIPIHGVGLRPDANNLIIESTMRYSFFSGKIACAENSFIMPISDTKALFVPSLVGAMSMVENEPTRIDFFGDRIWISGARYKTDLLVIDGTWPSLLDAITATPVTCSFLVGKQEISYPFKSAGIILDAASPSENANELYSAPVYLAVRFNDIMLGLDTEETDVGRFWTYQIPLLELSHTDPKDTGFDLAVSYRMINDILSAFKQVAAFRFEFTAKKRHFFIYPQGVNASVVCMPMG